MPISVPSVRVPEQELCDVVTLAVQRRADQSRQFEPDKRFHRVIGYKRCQLGEIRVECRRIDEDVVVQSLRRPRADDRVGWRQRPGLFVCADRCAGGGTEGAIQIAGSETQLSPMPLGRRITERFSSGASIRCCPAKHCSRIGSPDSRADLNAMASP